MSTILFALLIILALIGLITMLALGLLALGIHAAAAIEHEEGCTDYPTRPRHIR